MFSNQKYKKRHFLFQTTILKIFIIIFEVVFITLKVKSIALYKIYVNKYLLILPFVYLLMSSTRKTYARKFYHNRVNAIVKHGILNLDISFIAEHKQTRGSRGMAEESDTPARASDWGGHQHGRAARNFPPRKSRLGPKVRLVHFRAAKRLLSKYFLIFFKYFLNVSGQTKKITL